METWLNGFHRQIYVLNFLAESKMVVESSMMSIIMVCTQGRTGSKLSWLSLNSVFGLKQAPTRVQLNLAWIQRVTSKFIFSSDFLSFPVIFLHLHQLFFFSDNSSSSSPTLSCSFFNDLIASSTSLKLGFYGFKPSSSQPLFGLGSNPTLLCLVKDDNMCSFSFI